MTKITEAPPLGEEIHLPGPSLVPLINAAGLVITLLGLTTFRFLLIVGGLIFLVSLWRWITDVRRDISDLPAAHKH